MNPQTWRSLPKPTHRFSLRWLAAMAALAVLMSAASLALAPGQARAHALLVQSDPPVDARLAEPPAKVTASFSEPLDPGLSSMEVLDGSGETVSVGDTTFDPDDQRQMAVAVGELTPGFYAVVWETLSTIDGHLLKGSYPFTVLNRDGSEPTGPRLAGISGGVSGGEPEVGTVLAKWTVLAASVMLVGGLAFAVWVVRSASKELPADWKGKAREAGRRHLFWVAWPALALLAAAGAAELVLQVRQLGGPEFLDEVLATFWGERWIQRQIVLGAIALALGVSWRLQRLKRERLSEAALWVSLAGGLGYLILLSMISHAGAVEGSFWAVTSDFIHLVAAAVWIGTLAQLGLLLLWSRRSVADDVKPTLLAAHLQRFSVLAAVAVLLLLASGTFSAFVEVSSLEGMVDTPYGRVLSAKLALAVVLFAVAGLNAVILRPALVMRASEAGRDGIERLRRLLTRTVWLEAALAVGVLLVVGVLVQYPTTVQEEAAEAAASPTAEAVIGFENVATAGELELNMSVAPNQVGTNSFQVFVFPPPGEELAEILQVRLRFIPPDPEIGPSQAIAERVAPNFFKVTGSFFTQPGDWEVRVDIRRREVDDVSGRFTVPVGAPGAGGPGRFALPLQAGSWAVVATVGVLVGGLVLWAGVSQWPRLPRPVYRPLRVTRVASTTVGLVLVVATVTGFLELADRASSGNPIKPTAQSIAIGRSLFLQNCAQCHGDTGRGDGPLAPTLEVPPADFRIHIPFHTDLFFFQVMTNGFGRVMPAFGDQLTEEERWHILNFLQSEFGIEAQEAAQGGER